MALAKSGAPDAGFSLEGVTVMGEEAKGVLPPTADAGDGIAETDRASLNREVPNGGGWLVPNADFGADGAVPKALWTGDVDPNAD